MFYQTRLTAQYFHKSFGVRKSLGRNKIILFLRTHQLFISFDDIDINRLSYRIFIIGGNSNSELVVFYGNNFM